ncbi:MAG: hypothetical protein AzoDbin1_02136 [Azoarcus sp.]|nr:hypothetical protein [Azoarcus sp.]
MFELDDLLEELPRKKLIRGKWCAVRFSPDTSSGECLNIGVAFKPARGQIRTRLLGSAAGFRSLYGSSGVSNFNFLIALTAQSIQTHGDLVSPSPHVSFGPLRNAQGESVDAILETLYRTTVILRIPEEAPTSGTRTVNTRDLRQRVIRTLRTKHGDSVERFLHEQPVVLNFDNRPLLLDLPLWQAGDLVSGRTYGSIVSAQYADEVYRQHDLDRAFRNLEMASRFIAQNGRGALFILRPPSNDPAFPHRDIDNDIDAVAWPLARAGLRIEVEDTEPAIRRKIAGMIC